MRYKIGLAVTPPYGTTGPPPALIQSNGGHICKCVRKASARDERHKQGNDMHHTPQEALLTDDSWPRQSVAANGNVNVRPRMPEDEQRNVMEGVRSDGGGRDKQRPTSVE